ncbi:hypothetical protein MPH_11208 [Macrophomina phaseolina MS6]|uniref:Uncharacterized protein n=1 Tax=Macrophomina phaseolina (strain MS6) TaxID=1126212 RepID=K2S4R0_MACPH|nr:hypothetical protein MPH_11208 [Macrophomina phaseolina MS6]
MLLRERVSYSDTGDISPKPKPPSSLAHLIIAKRAAAALLLKTQELKQKRFLSCKCSESNIIEPHPPQTTTVPLTLLQPRLSARISPTTSRPKSSSFIPLSARSTAFRFIRRPSPPRGRSAGGPEAHDGLQRFLYFTTPSKSSFTDLRACLRVTRSRRGKNKWRE